MYKYKISFFISVETGFLFYHRLRQILIKKISLNLYESVIKRNCPPISRILCLKPTKSVSDAYHLSTPIITEGMYLPTLRAVRAALFPIARESRFIWHFNPQGLSTSRIAAKRRALLPHIFTLTEWLFVTGY